jgi:hypothetical protein
MRFLDGRVTAVSVGEAQDRNGAIAVPVLVHTLDPLRRMRSIGLECWVGPAGDSERQKSTKFNAAPVAYQPDKG